MSLFFQRLSRSRERAPSRVRGSAPAAGLLQQPIERQVQQVRTTAALDHDLADVRVHRLHRFEVQAVARDRGRLLVLGQHRTEALRITLGLGGDRGAMRFGLLAQARGCTLRLRNLVGRIGLTFILQPVTVGAGLEGIVERRLHLLRHLHALHVDVVDQDAGVQAVQLLLDRLHQTDRQRRALFVEHGIDVGATDDLSHRRLGGLAHGVVRAEVLEQVGARVGAPVLHGEADIDDVLVLRQHRRIAQAGGLRHRVAPHFNRLQLRHRNRFVRLERVRPAELDAGFARVGEAAKGGDHRLLAFLDDEDAAAEPHQQRDAGDQAHADAGALHVGLEVAAAAVAPALRRTWVVPTALAAEQARELAVEVAPQLVEIGWAVALVEQRQGARQQGPRSVADGREALRQWRGQW
jgi:hypothetical protein